MGLEKPLLSAYKMKTMGTHFLLKKHLANRNIEPICENWFHGKLSSIEGDVVFCHVGLSDVNSAFDGNPYEFLREGLHKKFDTIIVPGFTDYFTYSGVYHKKYSKPKHGMFARLLHEDAEYRTNDALRSFVVDGSFRFDSCNHRNSYSNNGCFAKLEQDDIPILNIGTPWFKSSQLHYLEYQYNVPYMKETTISGVFFDEEGKKREIEQTYGTYTETAVWNRRKIRQDLEKEDAMRSFDHKGLRLMITSAQSIRDVIGPKLKSDPYYLIK